MILASLSEKPISILSVLHRKRKSTILRIQVHPDNSVIMVGALSPFNTREFAEGDHKVSTGASDMGPG